MTSSVDTLVILGAGGDLSRRLLLPGLATLQASDRGRPLRLVGADRGQMGKAEWKSLVREAFASSGRKGRLVADTARGSRYVQTDVTDPEALRALLAECEGTPALFFALPPAVTVAACQALGQVDLPEGLVLVLEKPFGTDLESARTLNATLSRLVPEERIHRVDHFLGRSDVLNILGVRFANRLLEPVWSNAHIERIEILYDEQLTLEGRAAYYDKAGALVDMIQSHLLQIMALLLMNPPATLDERDLRDGKAQVLRATRLFGSPRTASRRARYTAGRIGEREVPAYTREPGVSVRNRTETLAEVTLEVNTWRWRGVPVTLRSGKALGHPRKEAVVTFKGVPHLPDGFTGTDDVDQLVIGFKPPRLELLLDVNGPRDPMRLDRAQLTADLAPGDLEAYGEILGGVVEGDPMLSVRGDTAEECWRIVEPVLASWQADDVPMETYPAGSDGPADWATSSRRG